MRALPLYRTLHSKRSTHRSRQRCLSYPCHPTNRHPESLILQPSEPFDSGLRAYNLVACILIEMPVSPTLPFDRTNIKPGDRICVAVSGGADSVALLLTLHAANSAKRDSLGVGLSAVHVHHGTPRRQNPTPTGTSSRPLHPASTSLSTSTTPTSPPAPPKPRRTIEEAARDVRYDFFPPSSPPATPTPSSPPTPSTTRPRPSS